MPRRYQFFLQIKQDVLQGRLPVSTDLAAELAALAVQCKLSLCPSCQPSDELFHLIDGQLNWVTTTPTVTKQAMLATFASCPTRAVI